MRLSKRDKIAATLNLTAGPQANLKRKLAPENIASTDAVAVKKPRYPVVLTNPNINAYDGKSLSY